MQGKSLVDLQREKSRLLEQIGNVKEQIDDINQRVGIDKDTNAKIEKEYAIIQKEKNRLTSELQQIGQKLLHLDSKRRIDGKKEILAAINNQDFYFIKNKPGVIFDIKTGLLIGDLQYYKWDEYFSVSKGEEKAEEITLGGYENWRMPSFDELSNIVKRTFPYKSGRNYRIQDAWYCLTYDLGRIELDGFGSYYNGSGYILWVNDIYNYDGYRQAVSEESKIYSEEERAEIVLNLMVEYGLEPIFNDEKVSKLYRELYIEKPVLDAECEKLEGKLIAIDKEIAQLSEKVKLSASFDFKRLLKEYDLPGIDESVIQYFEAGNKWLADLIKFIDEFENDNKEMIAKFNEIALVLHKEYEVKDNLTEEENTLFAERRKFFKKNFEVGLDSVKIKLIAMKKQVEEMEYRLDKLNEAPDSLWQLADYEMQKRPSFALVAENTARLITKAIEKLEYYGDYFELVASLVKVESAWTESYDILKQKYKIDLQKDSEDDGVEVEVWESWFADWVAKRLVLERKFLPLIEAFTQRKLISEFEPEKMGEEAGYAMPSILWLIDGLYNYKEKIDRFYLEERKGIHARFAFEAAGDIQEKFEVQKELYKLNIELQERVQKVIFNLENTEEKLFVLRWAEDLVELAIDEILRFVEDRDLDTISKEVILEFSNLKLSNLNAYLSDVKAYAKERKARDKEYDTLIFKMRKDIMKKNLKD